MAQRNPLNQRYQGDGPAGQSRKSATSAKPTTTAAASVRVKSGKPQTSAEKKQAAQERNLKLQKKAKERQRKAARARQAERTAEARAKLARGEISAEEAQALQNKTEPEVQEKPKNPGLFATPGTLAYALSSNPKYRKWRRIYWICLLVGLVFVIGSFVTQMMPGFTAIYFIIPAYALVLAGAVIHFGIIRPIEKAYKAQGASAGNKTPKQIKHEELAKSQAEQMEAARKAARRRPRRGRASEQLDPGAAVAAPGQAEAAVDAPGQATAADSEDLSDPAPIED